jgi:hypothetical protein
LKRKRDHPVLGQIFPSVTLDPIGKITARVSREERERSQQPEILRHQEPPPNQSIDPECVTDQGVKAIIWGLANTVARKDKQE